MDRQKDYYFEDVRGLIHYLFSNYGKLSPLKLQKGLYFLFAYYGAQYGKNIESEGISEINYDYPKYLFNADFEAWDYGPVIADVYHENKRAEYDKFLEDPYNVEENFKGDKELPRFIKEIFDQVIVTSDFSLVDRSHEDDVWKVAHQNGRTGMSKEDIVNEYAQEYTE